MPAVVRNSAYAWIARSWPGKYLAIRASFERVSRETPSGETDSGWRFSI
jgi:hypothetical protein